MTFPGYFTSPFLPERVAKVQHITAAVSMISSQVSALKRPTHLRHALVLFNGDKLVVHAVDQQYGHREFCVVDLVPFGPVLAAHHGAEHKGRHVEGIVVFQQLLLFGTLPSKASPGRRDGRFTRIKDGTRGFN